jgi:hypothetical protein
LKEELPGAKLFKDDPYWHAALGRIADRLEQQPEVSAKGWTKQTLLDVVKGSMSSTGFNAEMIVDAIISISHHPQPITNKCQCDEDKGWTTVMACNVCGFICDPVWQEKFQLQTISEGRKLSMFGTLRLLKDGLIDEEQAFKELNK